MQKLKHFLLFFLIVGCFSLEAAGLSLSENESGSDSMKVRTVDFSGFTWQVRNRTGNPGGNRWSDSPESVWVDEHGSLHLKIRKENGNWLCSEIFTQLNAGYGEYRFYVTGNLLDIDKNMVLGLFIYQDDKHEIDIEFSKWGKEDERNTGIFVTQPGSVKGNSKSFYVGSDSLKSTHSFIWKPKSIEYKSWDGHAENFQEKTLFERWTYEGKHIPKPGDEKLMINFWLFRGHPPTDETEKEVVINAVQFIPLQN